MHPFFFSLFNNSTMLLVGLDFFVCAPGWSSADQKAGVWEDGSCMGRVSSGKNSAGETVPATDLIHPRRHPLELQRVPSGRLRRAGRRTGTPGGRWCDEDQQTRWLSLPLSSYYITWASNPHYSHQYSTGDTAGPAAASRWRSIPVLQAEQTGKEWSSERVFELHNFWLCCKM